MLLFKNGMPYWAPDKGGAGGGPGDDAEDADDEEPTGEGQEPEPEDEEEDEDEFDAERAMATIKNQRAAERELKKQLAAVKKQVAEFEAEEKKRERAKLSEIEKAQAELAEIQASHAETIAQLNEMRLLTAFSRTAEGMEGVAFANPQARQDAFALMDLGEITIDDEGQVDVKAMEKAIKALQKSRPHLFVEEEQGGMGTPRRASRRLPAPEGKEERPLKPLVQF